jgi:hypothetical protein
MTNTVSFLKNKINSYLLGKIAYSIFAGVFGTIILVLFLATFLCIFEVVKFIPWIIALNTAITGYSLLDKTRDQLKYRQLSSIGAGVLNVIFTYIILCIISVNFLGEYLLGIRDFIVFLIIGVICSELGALLAIRYFRLKK